MDPILTFPYRTVLPPTLITDERDQTDGLLTVHAAAPCRPIRNISELSTHLVPLDIHRD